MEPRKMAGWCFIVFGVINVLQGIYINETKGRGMTTLFIIITSLLFTVGAAFLWVNKKGRPSS